MSLPVSRQYFMCFWCGNGLAFQTLIWFYDQEWSKHLKYKYIKVLLVYKFYFRDWQTACGSFFSNNNVNPSIKRFLFYVWEEKRMSYERLCLDWTLTLSDKQDKRMSDTIYAHPLVRVYQFCWVMPTLMPLNGTICIYAK